MAKILNGSICLSDIPRQLIKSVVCKDGITRKYLNIAVIEKKEPKTFVNADGKTRTYTHFLTCSPRKEEQQEGVNYILGDLQTYEFNPQTEPVSTDIVDAAPADDSSELPF